MQRRDFSWDCVNESIFFLVHNQRRRYPSNSLTDICAKKKENNKKIVQFEDEIALIINREIAMKPENKSIMAKMYIYGLLTVQEGKNHEIFIFFNKKDCLAQD